MTYHIITPPIVEPISLDLARRHLRMVPDSDSPPFHPDDAWLEEIGIPAAREHCEHFMGRAVSTQTVEVAFDSFSATIALPLSPVESVTSVTYIDADGNEQTLSPTVYALDSFAEPGAIRLATGEAWPLTYTVSNAVRVRYRTGYTTLGDSPDDRPLPAAIKAAMLLMIGHLYENREATVMPTNTIIEIPLGIAALLVPHQLRMSMA